MLLGEGGVHCRGGRSSASGVSTKTDAARVRALEGPPQRRLGVLAEPPVCIAGKKNAAPGEWNEHVVSCWRHPTVSRMSEKKKELPSRPT